jgi:osmotically-inducible protein OsmY
MAARPNRRKGERRAYDEDSPYGFNTGYGYPRQGFAHTDAHGMVYKDDRRRRAQFRERSGARGASWHGPESGYRREPGPHTGRGPRNYRRPDSRIREEVNDRLTQHGRIDATHMIVEVKHGEVTLKGRVASRQAKRWAENLAWSVMGVHDVHNQMRIEAKAPGWQSRQYRELEDNEEQERADNGQRRTTGV